MLLTQSWWASAYIFGTGAVLTAIQLDFTPMYRASANLIRLHSTSPAWNSVGIRQLYTGLSDAVAKPELSGMGERRPKKEGTIEDIFTAFTNAAPPLPQRFSELKKNLFTEQLIESWREVLDELAVTTKEVAEKGAAVSVQSFIS